MSIPGPWNLFSKAYLSIPTEKYRGTLEKLLIPVLETRLVKTSLEHLVPGNKPSYHRLRGTCEKYVEKGARWKIVEPFEHQKERC